MGADCEFLSRADPRRHPKTGEKVPDKSQSQHILELSKELLDDIELSRIDADKLLLKCSRLARLVGSEEIQQWIEYEMKGYNVSDALSLKYMSSNGTMDRLRKEDRLLGTSRSTTSGTRCVKT